MDGEPDTVANIAALTFSPKQFQAINNLLMIFSQHSDDESVEQLAFATLEHSYLFQSYPLFIGYLLDMVQRGQIVASEQKQAA